MCPCINRNARPNNNQLYTYYKHVSYLLKNTYNTSEYYLQYINNFVIQYIKSVHHYIFSNPGIGVVVDLNKLFRFCWMFMLIQSSFSLYRLQPIQHKPLHLLCRLCLKARNLENLNIFQLNSKSYIRGRMAAGHLRVLWEPHHTHYSQDLGIWWQEVKNKIKVLFLCQLFISYTKNISNDC